MGLIPGFKGTVYRNGEPIRFKNASISYETGKLLTPWQISLDEPVITDPSDTYSIEIEFAGAKHKLLSDVKAESWGGDITLKTATTTISSRTRDDSDILVFAIPKTFVFINQRWLQKTDASAKIQGGIVVTKGGVRFYHERLPDKSHKGNLKGNPSETPDFECFYAESHHDIAKQLARMMGAKLLVNTPDIPLVDTCIFDSGTLWFECVKKNFMMWCPEIYVLRDEKDPTIPTIVIDDIMSGTGQVAVTKKLSLDNPAIVSVNRKTLSGENASYLNVDHIVVTGRKTQDTTYMGTKAEEPDYTPVEIPCQEFEPTITVRSSFQQDDMSKFKQWGDYSGAFGTPPDDWTVKKPTEHEHFIYYHEYRDGNQNKRIPVREKTQDSNAEGPVSKVMTKHYYSPDKKKITKTVEEYYFVTNMPGKGKEKKMEKLRVKTTLQNYVVKPLNLTLTKEMIEDIVIYVEFVQQIEGRPTTIKDDPKPMLEALKANANYVDTRPTTKQKTMEMTTYYKFTYIDRCDDNTLIKNEVICNVLQKNLPQINSQILDNPHKDDIKGQANNTDNVYREEFKDLAYSNGYHMGQYWCFHPARTVNHDDICTYEIAKGISDRIFLRKHLAEQESLWEITVQTPVPILLNWVAIKVLLPDITRNVNGMDVTIPASTFFLKKVTYNIASSGKGNTVRCDFNQTLVVGSQL
jgi:hypothetical protein